MAGLGTAAATPDERLGTPRNEERRQALPPSLGVLGLLALERLTEAVIGAIGRRLDAVGVRAKAASALRQPPAIFDAMFAWMDRHPRLVDLAVVASALALSISLADELGVAIALSVGLLAVLLVNIAFALRPPSR